MAWSPFRVVVAAVLLLAGAAGSARPAELWIHDARIVDLETATVSGPSDVVVRDGVIVAVQASPSRSPAAAARHVDAAGGYLLPGLVDLHHHLAQGTLERETAPTRRRLLEELPSWGITAVLDPNLALGTWRELEPLLPEAGACARVYRTGPSIGAEGGWAGEGVAGPEAARASVRAAAAAGVDAIKLVLDDMTWLGSRAMPVLDPETLAATVDEARRAGLPVWAHAPRLELAKRALRAGVTGLVHGVVSGAVDDELIGLMREREAVYVPTHVLFETYADFAHGVRRQQLLDPQERRRYQDLTSKKMLAEWRSWWDRTGDLAKQLPVLRANLRALAEAGVLIAAGTDAGTPGVLSGVSLHLELRLMVEAGLTPAQALRSATLGAAAALGLAGDRGRIAAGQRADLLLLRESPLDRLSALESLDGVVLAGRAWRVSAPGAGLEPWSDAPSD